MTTTTKPATPEVQRLLRAVSRAHFTSVQSELHRLDLEAIAGEDYELPQEWVENWWVTFTTSNDWVN